LAGGTLHRPDVQTLPRERIRALQEERLRAVIGRAVEQPVPFFARKLARAGVGTDDVKTLDDLRHVPRTVKQELRDAEAAHPPLGDYRGASQRECVRLSTSSGTTGRPTIMLFTQHDLAVEYDAAGRMFARQGYKPGEIITHAHPAGLNGGAALLGGAIEAYGALNVSVGPPATPRDAEAAVRLWQELKPDRYEMFGPALHTFWETAKSLGLDPEKDLGMAPPADMPLWRTVSAGIDCFAFLGSACDAASGAHVCEDEAIVEAVDPASGEPVPDGRRGHLVVTTLTKDNFMLRYDLEDLVRLDRSGCACGETHLRAFWDGRAADVVTVAGRELLPVDVQVVLSRFEEITLPALEFQMVRRANADRLEVRAETPAPAEPLRAAAADALHVALDVPVDLVLLETGALPRPAYKPLRVVDE
jgi:phenylacetate-CoA ligase